MGDVNIDFLKNNTALHKKYSTILSSFNCKQLITEATRVTANSSSVLDHVLTNDLGKVKTCGVLGDSISDHLPVYLLRCFRNSDPGTPHNPPPKKVRSLKNYSPALLSQELHLTDWSPVLFSINVDDALGKFATIFHGILDKIAPVRELRVRQKSEPWMNSDILSCIKKRNQLFSQYRRDMSRIDVYRNYCKFRNKVQREIKLAKKFFFRDKIRQNRDDTRKLWGQLKSLGYQNRTNSDPSIVLTVNDEKCFDARTVASTFNSFYTVIAQKLVGMLPDPCKLFAPDSLPFRRFYSTRGIFENSFVLTPVSRGFILGQLRGLKADKSTGLDGISARFLKDGANFLTEPIAHIINFSIMSEAVPSGFKDARVIPLFKKGSRLDPGNYRPVSILNTLSKLLERAVCDQLTKYLETKNVLYGFQSGFRGKFSTETCLVELTDYLRDEVSKGNFVGMIMIDLQKAFDCVDHGILLEKLRVMGIGNLDWFRSYLSGRRQCVVVNGTQSDFMGVSCGVPQGSILGPILFLCYVNDMSCSLKCRLSLYADDSALVAAGKSVSELSTFLSSELESCNRWMVDNKLSLHVGKTESLLFGTSRMLGKAADFTIKCGGTTVANVDSVKYLGVTLDSRLTGETHALKAIGKISARLSFLYRQSSLLDMNTRKILCVALIQPLFDYCCTAWHEGLTAKLKGRFDTLQRKMVRYIYSLDPRCHVGLHDFKQLGWLTVRDRVSFFRLVHVFKISRGAAPSYLSNGFTAVRDVHSYNTRGSVSDYHISDKVLNSLKRDSFGFKGRKEWNSLPQVLKQAGSLDAFKKKLKAHFMEQY